MIDRVPVLVVPLGPRTLETTMPARDKSPSESPHESPSQSPSEVASEPLLPSDDHRALMARLDLCHFQDEAPAMVFWHPRGWTLYQLLENSARAQVAEGGYREVRTPQLMRRPVWERSGHWGAFHDGMFAFGHAADESALKPVSCPGHIQLVRKQAPSWRDLPIRIAEFGLVHRNEATGSLHGLFRLRQFTQDDGHIFCTEDQVAGEVARFCRELPAFYRRFGFTDVSVALSLRPDNRLGDDAWWDRAERELGDVAAGLGIPCEVQPGGGAIYGPKLEFLLRDRRGRPWQCGTIQLDFVMPQRFDVRYVDSLGERRHVVMLHRALFGSIERFLGILLEHHGAALPAWLAPDQVAVVPVSASQRGHAADIAARLTAVGLRCRLDADGGTVSRRIALAHHDGVPFVVVIGDREVNAGTLAVRARDGQWSSPAGDAITELIRRASVQNCRSEHTPCTA
ncbi:MAG TPA: threonine--tRNA ligase [Kofleriaceae bacterium]|nr:threonine--tRNA ligase [Kofleriaceae bacterium]